MAFFVYSRERHTDLRINLLEVRGIS